MENLRAFQRLHGARNYAFRYVAGVLTQVVLRGRTCEAVERMEMANSTRLPVAGEDRVIECPVCSDVMTKMETEGVTVGAVERHAGRRGGGCGGLAIAG